MALTVYLSHAPAAGADVPMNGDSLGPSVDAPQIRKRSSRRISPR